MLAARQPSLVESLCLLWAELNKATVISLIDAEVQYLVAMAMGADCDTVSHLLLKKVRMARVVAEDALPANTVRMNSYVEFSAGGEGARFAQLLHPSTAGLPPWGLPVTGLIGAGLVGLSAGQTILWPGADGELADLAVFKAELCPGLDRWLAEAAR